jgi:hypothetical protein
MYSLGKHILNYLTESEYRYNLNVIESNILDVETSYKLFCESSFQINFKKNLFYSPNITLDFLVKFNTDNHFFLDSEKMSFLSLVTEDEINENPKFDYLWNPFSLLQNQLMSPNFVINKFNNQLLYKNQKYINRCIIFNKYCSLSLINNLNINLSNEEIMYLVGSESIEIHNFEYLLEKMKQNTGRIENSIYKRFSKNKNLCIHYILLNLDKEWDWYLLSSNPSFDIIDIVNHAYMPWKSSHLSIHPKLTIQDVLKYNKINWNYNYLCVNKNITIYDLEKLPHDLFINLFNNKFIYMNEYWDVELFEKYHRLLNFSQDNLNLMFFAKKSWIRYVYLKKKIVSRYYDELMAYTWKPSRLVNWIWDTEQLKEWYSLPE